MPFPFRKTLLLGLGGAGSQILLYVKKHLLTAYGQVPLSVRFLCVDTDDECLAFDGVHGSPPIRCTIERAEHFHLSEERPNEVFAQHPSVKNWYDGPLPLLNAICHGSGAIPAVGRLAFVANLRGFLIWLDKINSDLLDLKLASNMHRQGFSLSEGPVEVVIFCSLAGGTGAGIVLDVARLVSACLPESCIRGFCLSAWPFRYKSFSHRVYANANSTLAALDEAQSRSAPLLQPELQELGVYDTNIQLPAWPFDSLTIMDGRTELGSHVSSLGDMCQIASHTAALLLSLPSPCTATLLNDASRKGGGRVPHLTSESTHGYSSVGLAAICYPASQMRRHRALSLAVAVCDQLASYEDAQTPSSPSLADGLTSSSDDHLPKVCPLVHSIGEKRERFLSAQGLLAKQLEEADKEIRRMINDPCTIVLGDGERVFLGDSAVPEFKSDPGGLVADVASVLSTHFSGTPERFADLIVDKCMVATAGLERVSVTRALATLASEREEKWSGDASRYLEDLYCQLLRLAALLVDRAQLRVDTSADDRTLCFAFGSESDATDEHKRAIAVAWMSSGIPFGKHIYCATGDSSRISVFNVQRGLSSTVFVKEEERADAAVTRDKGSVRPVGFAQAEPSRNSQTHDVFISYRRDGGEHLAARVKQALGERGFSVFMDVEDLKSGRFDEALLEKIEQATDVVVILTPGCLDRCSNEGDWLGREIGHAISLERNVIPLIARNFHMPLRDTLPADMRELPRYNGFAPSHEMWDASMDRLTSTFLKSKPRNGR